MIEVIEMIIQRICHNFANTGHCRFGHKYRYRHINHSSSLEFDFKARDRSSSDNYYTSRPKSVHTFNNANFDRKFIRIDDFKESINFLGELKDIVKGLKGIVESHHVTQPQHPAAVYPNPQVLICQS